MPGKGSSADRDGLITDLQKLADNMDKRPKVEDMRKHGPWSRTPYSNEFGSWDNALRAAGLKPRKPNKSDLVSDLRELSNQLGRTPSSHDYRKHGTWSPKPILNKFGTWTEAIKTAGLSPRVTQHHEYSPDEIIKEIERVDEKFDRPLKSGDLDEDRKAPNHKTVAKYFGSVDDAIRQSSVDIYRFNEPTDIELLEDIRRVSDNSEPPPVPKYDKSGNGLYSSSRFVRRFGSWRQAVVEAGFRPRDVGGKIPEHKLLDELKSLGDLYEEIPTYNQMDNNGKYSANVYERHFGSWINALREAEYPVEERLGKARPPIALSPQEMNNFVDTVNGLTSQLNRLTCLFLLFMGTSPQTYSKLDEDWITKPQGSGDMFIEIPETAPHGERVIGVPNTWRNPITGNEETHHLKDLIEWYFKGDHTSSVDLHKISPTIKIHRVAMKADIDWKNTVTVSGGQRYPDLQARDLRETHGVHIARNGANPLQIKRRLGLKSKEEAQRYIDQIK